MQMMMGSLMLLAVALVTVSCVNSPKVFENDSPKVTQIRPLKGFERIEIFGSPTVFYTQADSFSVHVAGPEDLVDEIITKVDGKTLSIRNKGKIGIVNIGFSGQRQLEVHVTSPDLISVQLNGSGDFISNKKVDTDEMSIVLRGSGDVDFKNIICDHCKTELVGSGDVDVDRLEALTSDIMLIGSGDVEVKQYNVGETAIELKGSGDISVNFMEGCQKASCRLVGSGDIKLKGTIGQFSKQKSGSGDIDTDKLTIEK